MRPDVLCRPPAGVATLAAMDDDQLQLFPGAELPKEPARCKRPASPLKASADLVCKLRGQLKRTGEDVIDFAHFFGGRWVNKFAWGAKFRREVSPEGQERAWNRLRVRLKEAGCPHEDRPDGMHAQAKEMRLLPRALAWAERLAPLPPYDEEEDDLTWEELERLLGHLNTKRDDA